MRKHHGELTTIKYLKASQLSVQKAIGKDRINSLRDIEPDLPLPRLTSSKLPRIIPLGDRRAILSGSPSVIRWWLTMFGVYRVLKAPGMLKLSTITAPFSGSQDLLDRASLELRVIALSFKKFGPKELKPAKMRYLETASPSFKVSWTGLIHDYLSLGINNLETQLQYLLKASKSEDLLNLVQVIQTLVRSGGLVAVYEASGLGNPFFKWTSSDLDKLQTAQKLIGGKLRLSPIGQLTTKEEAAGKIRVFAMVDT